MNHTRHEHISIVTVSLFVALGVATAPQASADATCAPGGPPPGAATKDGRHQIIVDTGRDAKLYAADGCTIASVVDVHGEPFTFDEATGQAWATASDAATSATGRTWSGIST